MTQIRQPEALDYIRKELARFADRRDLRALLGLHVIEAGTVFSFLNVYRPDDALEKYGAEVFAHSVHHYYGGLINADLSYRTRELEFVSRWLNGAPNRVALFQTDYFRFRTGISPYKLADGERVALCDTDQGRIEGFEAWVILDEMQSTRDDVELALARAMSPYPPVLGFLAHRASGPPREQVTFIGPEEQRGLAHAAQVLIIGAFDGEALLFWRPSHFLPEAVGKVLTGD